MSIANLSTQTLIQVGIEFTAAAGITYWLKNRTDSAVAELNKKIAALESQIQQQQQILMFHDSLLRQIIGEDPAQKTLRPSQGPQGQPQSPQGQPQLHSRGPQPTNSPPNPQARMRGNQLSPAGHEDIVANNATSPPPQVIQKPQGVMRPTGPFQPQSLPPQSPQKVANPQSKQVPPSPRVEEEPQQAVDLDEILDAELEKIKASSEPLEMVIEMPGSEVKNIKKKKAKVAGTRKKKSLNNGQN